MPCFWCKNPRKPFRLGTYGLTPLESAGYKQRSKAQLIVNKALTPKKGGGAPLGEGVWILVRIGRIWHVGIRCPGPAREECAGRRLPNDWIALIMRSSLLPPPRSSPAPCDPAPAVCAPPPQPTSPCPGLHPDPSPPRATHRAHSSRKRWHV